MYNNNMDDIRERIKSNEIDKTVNVEKQNRHIRGSREYVEGRSYLLDGVDAQGLVNQYHGTGVPELSWDGSWTSREFVVADRNIGVSVNAITREETPINRFKIHYSKTGTHVVPTLRE